MQCLPLYCLHLHSHFPFPFLFISFQSPKFYMGIGVMAKIFLIKFQFFLNLIKFNLKSLLPILNKSMFHIHWWDWIICQIGMKQLFQPIIKVLDIVGKRTLNFVTTSYWWSLVMPYFIVCITNFVFYLFFGPI